MPINKKRRQGLLPATVCLLCIDQVIVDDLPCSDSDIMQDPFQDLAYGVIKRAVEDYWSLGNKLNECEDCIEEKRIEEGIIIHDMNLRKWLRTFHLFIKIEKQISSIT